MQREGFLGKRKVLCCQVRYPLLEKGDAPLADSLRLFEEGTKLVNACSTELDKAEQQVVKLMKGPDGAPVELPFESTED